MHQHHASGCEQEQIAGGSILVAHRGDLREPTDWVGFEVTSVQVNTSYATPF